MTPDEELAIIRTACLAIDQLPDQKTRERVVEFIFDRYVRHPLPLPGGDIIDQEGKANG